MSAESHLHRWRDKHYNPKVESLIFRGYRSGARYVKGRWWSCYEKAWTEYFQKFEPKFWKPSAGTIAVFLAVERWRPEKIGLIGMDWVLDGNPDWFHDAAAEKKAIEALPVEIIDLRGRRNTGQTGIDAG